MLARSVSRLVTRRDLALAALFAPDLAAVGLRRSDLIDTPKSAYAGIVAWARAIHDADPRVDGLVWTSRRCDPDRCVVLFGDRVRTSDLAIVETRRVSADAALLLELRGFGRRAGITIVS